MKGYNVGFGYFGLIDGKYMLFATEDEYEKYWFVHEFEKD